MYNKPTSYTSQITREFYRSAMTALKAQRFSSVQEQAPALIAMNCDREGVKDVRHVAYMLATCWHESRWSPIREIKAKEDSDIWKLYQSKYWPSGFFGRGYVQLTWRKNYELWSKLTGVDIVNNPDAVLQPELSALILVKGMNEGLFTNRKLSQYINDTACDFINARKTVNGTMHAKIIAGHAEKLLPLLCQI